MKVKVNGQIEKVKENITLLDFVESKGLKPENVVIEYNLNIVKSEEWSNTVLKENDSLEVLSFVGGG